MQQPPHLLMIKYKSSLLGNFSRQKAKRLLHWGQKDEKLLGLEGLQEISVSISCVCNGVPCCLSKRHCRTAYVWKARYVFLFPEKRFLLLQSCKDSEEILLFLSAMHETEHEPLRCPHTIPALESVPKSKSSGMVDPPQLYAPLLLLPPRSVCGGESRCQTPRGWAFQ